MKPAWLLTLALLCLQCETLRPGLRINSFGEYDSELEQILANRASKIESTHGIRVFDGDSPKGISLSNDGSKILIEKKFTAQYEILGVVEADYVQSGRLSSIYNYLWTWSDYEARWRTAACYMQAPLKALSLGLWNLLPPAWLCFKYAPDEITRKSELLSRLLKAAKALDGNILIVVDQGEILITGERGEILDDAKYASLHGFVLRER